MDLRHLTLAIEGRRRAREQEYRESWERTRWMTTALLQPYAPKGRSIKPRDLARFPWEEDNKPKAKPLDLWTKWDKEMKAKYG